MIIYPVDGTHEVPEVWTDEPYYDGGGISHDTAAEEMAVQAHRTARKFRDKLAREQMYDQ